MRTDTGQLLMPQVTSLPVPRATPATRRGGGALTGSEASSLPGFDQVLDSLSQIQVPLKFSAHATQRLKERQLNFDPARMTQIQQAVDLAEQKGIESGLILTPEAALIVDIKSRTVITAMDRGAAQGNVFSQIDGAVIV